MRMTLKQSVFNVCCALRMASRHLVLTIALTLLMMPGISIAEPTAVPANAYPLSSNYGDPWQCHRGYIKNNDACDAIRVPANAHLRASGDRWACNRGYRKEIDTCVAIVLPAHGFLTKSSYSKGWMCERGYRAFDDKCVVIDVPVNGYLSDSTYSHGWVCERGYKAKADECLPVKLPDNAHLDYSGNSWECTPPYHRINRSCVLR